MRYNAMGLIGALLERFLDALDPYPNRKRNNVVHGDKVESNWSAKELSDAYVAAKEHPEKEYWQDLLNQHLDERERENAIISGMMIQDYEERHKEDRAEGERDKEKSGEFGEQESEGSETEETSGEAGREQESADSSQDATQDEGGEAGDMGAAGEADFDQGSDFDSGDFGSGDFESGDSGGGDSGYTGYIG